MIEALALAGRPPGETAVRWGDATLDRGTLAARAQVVAGHLAGLPDGALVGLRLRNEPAFLVAFLGCLLARRPAALLDPYWTDAERHHASARLGGVALVQGESDVLPDSGGLVLDSLGGVRAHHPRPVLAQRPGLGEAAVIHWSSGSTGRPKPIVVPREALAFRGRTAARALELSPGDRLLAFVPLTHSHGLDNLALPALFAGAELALMDPWQATPAAVAEAIGRLGITHVSGLPRFWAAWQEADVAPAGLATLRVPVCGSAALAPDVARAFAQRVGRRLRIGYGVTEVGLICCHGPRSLAEPYDDVGSVQPGVEWRLHERDAEGVGELWVRSPGDASGYLDDDVDRVRTPDGWWRTQDLVRQAADGALVLVGRAGGFINVNGSKADPREIEQVLEALPWVAECAVRGVADGGGEEVVAWVVPRDGAPADVEHAVQERVAAVLSAFKVPRRVLVLPRLPRSTLGKVLYASLPRPAAREPADVAPAHALEREVAALWAGALGCEAVSVVDDFFAQGGDSLRLAQLLAVLRARFDAALTLADLFRWPTVRAQAQALGGRAPGGVLEQSLDLARRQREALERPGRFP